MISKNSPPLVSVLLDYVSQDALRHVPLGAAEKVSRESPSAELRLRHWGRGDISLPERPVTHFLPGSGPNRRVASSSPAS